MGNVLDNVGSAFSKKPMRVDCDESIHDCAKQMQSSGIGLLLVYKGDVLEGVVSERDLVFKVLALGQSSVTDPISSVMSSPVISISSKEGLIDAWEMMKEKNFRHLVVRGDDDGVVGVLSIRDILDKLAMEKQVETILKSKNINIEYGIV